MSMSLRAARDGTPPCSLCPALRSRANPLCHGLTSYVALNRAATLSIGHLVPISAPTLLDPGGQHVPCRDMFIALCSLVQVTACVHASPPTPTHALIHTHSEFYIPCSTF
jgi:hypothetical protein